MVIVENKKTTLTKDSEDDFVTYGDLIKICLNVTPKEGWSKDLIQQVCKIEEVIENTKKSKPFSFEDADMNLIREKVGPMAWTMKNLELADFQDYIKDCN